MVLSNTKSSKKQNETQKTSTSTQRKSSTSQTTTSSSSNAKKTIEKSGSGTSITSGVNISELSTDILPSGSTSSFQSLGRHYTVETPDLNPNKGKEHIIFGGTQIVEVETQLSGGADPKSFLKTGDNIIVTTDGGDVITTSEVVSHSTASSSSVQKSSSSSYVIEIVDGKERIIDSKTREWGASDSKNSEEHFHLKAGTGIEPTISYTQKLGQDQEIYDSGVNGKKPIYEKSSIESGKSISQKGGAAPVEYSTEKSEGTIYDNKTKKFLTSSTSAENQKILDQQNFEKIIDSIHLQQHIDDGNRNDIIHSIQAIDQSNRQGQNNISSNVSQSQNTQQHSTTEQHISSSSTSHSTSQKQQQQSSSSKSFLDSHKLTADVVDLTKLDNKRISSSSQDFLTSERQDIRESQNVKKGDVTTTSSSNFNNDDNQYRLVGGKLVKKVSDKKTPAGQSTNITDLAENVEHVTSSVESHSTSSQSTTQKSSSTSYVYEIVNGVKRLVDSHTHESGASDTKTSDEHFRAKSGTGIEPEMEYNRKLGQNQEIYDSGDKSRPPIYEKSELSSEKFVTQKGDQKPVEFTKESTVGTVYDNKTDKFITSTTHSENQKQLENTTTSSKNVTDSSILFKSDNTTTRDDKKSIDTSNNKSRTRLVGGKIVKIPGDDDEYKKPAGVSTRDSRKTDKTVTDLAENVTSSTSFTESHSTSNQSSTQKQSTTSYVYEIVDGVERLIDSRTHESGTNDSKVTAENFRAKSGTGIETEVIYDKKVGRDHEVYDSGDKNRAPIYEKTSKLIEKTGHQKGDNKPVESTTEFLETTVYDSKTDKFLTDVKHSENQKLLENTRKTDSSDIFIRNEKQATTTSDKRVTDTSEYTTKLVGGKIVKIPNPDANKPAAGKRTPSDKKISPSQSHPTTKHPDSTTLQNISDVTSTSNIESHSTTSQFSTQTQSSSSYVVEIVDGVERIVDRKVHESGISDSKRTNEHFTAKSGTGIEPEVSYNKKSVQDHEIYDSGDQTKKPLYEKSTINKDKYVTQKGDRTPVESTRESIETTVYDDRTDKFITSTDHFVDQKSLTSSVNRTDTDSTYTTKIVGGKIVKIPTNEDSKPAAGKPTPKTRRGPNDNYPDNRGPDDREPEGRGPRDGPSKISPDTMPAAGVRRPQSQSSPNDYPDNRGPDGRGPDNKGPRDGPAKVSPESLPAAGARKPHRQSSPSDYRGPDNREPDQRGPRDGPSKVSPESLPAAGARKPQRQPSPSDNRGPNIRGPDHRNPRDGPSKVSPESLPAAGARKQPQNQSPYDKYDERPIGGKPKQPSDHDTPYEEKPAAGRPSRSQKPKSEEQPTFTPKDKKKHAKISPDALPAAGRSSREPHDKAPHDKDSPHKRSQSPYERYDNRPVGGKKPIDYDNFDSSTIDTMHTTTLTSDNKVTTQNVSEATTVFTSKVYDETTNNYQVVGESTVSETDFVLTRNDGTPKRQPIKPQQPDDKRITSTTKTDKTDKTNIIDSKTSKSTTSSTSTKRNSINKQQIYDERTKTWKEVDEKTLTTRRPSLMRYVSQEIDGSVTTIFKRKVYDQRTGKWKVVDEKVFKNQQPNDPIPELPEIIDNVTNTTTTTYTTKVFDTKTGVWRVIDTKSFVDEQVHVPNEIVQEIEKDHPDVANITTTTEITKVSSNIFLN